MSSVMPSGSAGAGNAEAEAMAAKARMENIDLGSIVRIVCFMFDVCVDIRL